eukprot:jgi/Astpho2/9333/fgenesh1_pm.00142_%23_5_t
MYGGDEVNALVADIGTHTTKAGYAGEDTPKAWFPSAVGVLARGADSNGAAPMDVDQRQNGTPKAKFGPKRGSRGDLYVGSAALSYRRDYMEVEQALKQGLHSDMELVQAILEHAFTDRLWDLTQHPLMLAEPTFNTRELRERLTEIVFEQFGSPALFLAKNAALSAYATGRQTALVADAGHEGTVVAAVHDGYVLGKSCVRSSMGGAMLTRCMLSATQTLQGHQRAEVRPRYSLKRVENAAGAYEVQQLDQPHTTASFRQWHIDQIGNDMKENICRVAESTFNAVENASIPTASYELPDGKEIHVGPDKHKIPETLFNAVNSIVQSINKCDVDLRASMYPVAVLTGGTSQLSGLRERLERELGEVAAQNARVKVHTPANMLERRFGVWLGGSILGSLGTFQQMWMSKAEYAEHGATMMQRRAP